MYIHGDNDLNIQSLRNFLQPINLHIYAKEEHVGLIKNAIKTIKERARYVCHTAPYRRYMCLMTQSLIEGIIYIPNFFPSKNAISDTMVPAMLVEGKHKLDFGNKRIKFGAYAMVYVGTHNNMKKRSVPEIVLKASNEEGGYLFMSLYSGKRLHSYIWEELPIDQDIIDRLEQLAREKKTSFGQQPTPF